MKKETLASILYGRFYDDKSLHGDEDMKDLVLSFFKEQKLTFQFPLKVEDFLQFLNGLFYQYDAIGNGSPLDQLEWLIAKTVRVM